MTAAKKEKPDKMTLQQKRWAKARKMLAAWQRRARIAGTKVREYQRKCRYYENRELTAAAIRAEAASRARAGIVPTAKNGIRHIEFGE